jgi:hypothetical protein
MSPNKNEGKNHAQSHESFCLTNFLLLQQAYGFIFLTCLKINSAMDGYLVNWKIKQLIPDGTIIVVAIEVAAQ